MRRARRLLLSSPRAKVWFAAHGINHINRFINGVTSDLDAVTAGLSLSFSSGPVEGNVNRIKMLKRQMYGRANFDLLRKRVLLASRFEVNHFEGRT